MPPGLDSVFPHGIGKMVLRKAEHAAVFDEPIDPYCGCSTCRNHSRAYLNHLIRADEPMSATLLTVHNVHFMNDIMQGVRERILQDEM